MQLCDNFPWLIFICLIPFFQGCLRLISCIILLKEFVFLKLVDIKMGKRYHFGYHTSNCKDDQTLHDRIRLWMLISFSDKYILGQNMCFFSSTDKTDLTGYILVKKNYCSLKKVNFKKKRHIWNLKNQWFKNSELVQSKNHNFNCVVSIIKLADGYDPWP